MKLNRWSWGYIPVALVLGLIWFEAWHSGAFKAGEQPAPTDTPDAGAVATGGTTVAPPVTPVTPPTSNPPLVAVGPPRAVVPVAPVIGAPPPIPPEPPAPVKPVLNEAFLHNPPPITVSFNNAPLDSAVQEIKDAFHMPANFSVQANGNNGRTFSLDAKNKPFWEVIRSLQDQGGFGFYPSGAGLVLSTSYSPIYHFEISGPAILYATNISYSRPFRPESPGDRQPGHYQLNLGVAVDPRIPLAHTFPVEILEAVDENGRPVPVPATGGGVNSSAMVNNAWTSYISNIPEPSPRPKSLSLKCQVRFSALLATSDATIEDATSKQGEVVTVGDRKLRLTRCELQGTSVIIQITSEDGTPVTNVNCTLTGSGGQSTTFTLTGAGQRSFPAQLFSPPCRLNFRDNTPGQEVSVPFELKEIPLP